MRVAWIPLLLLIATMAFSLDTQVIPDSDLSKRVPMTTVFYLGSFLARPVRTSDFTAREVDESVLVQGKRWRAILSPAIRGLWETNSNGRRTYYFAGYTGGAGMAPGTWLLILSFDEQGRPVPFYVVGRAQYDSRGIVDVLNWMERALSYSNKTGRRRIGCRIHVPGITSPRSISSEASTGIAPMASTGRVCFHSMRNGPSL